MPGKIRRAALYDRVLQRNPVLHLGGKTRPSPLSDKEYLAFVESVGIGLFKRLQRLRNDEEATALTAAIGRLESAFWHEVRAIGIQEARAHVIKVVAESKIPELKRLACLPPLHLAEEASQLNSTIPPRKDIKTRKRWVTDQGLAAEDAPETDAYLIERILGNRYQISSSQVHKILAKVRKFSR